MAKFASAGRLVARLSRQPAAGEHIDANSSPSRRPPGPPNKGRPHRAGGGQVDPEQHWRSARGPTARLAHTHTHSLAAGIWTAHHLSISICPSFRCAQAAQTANSQLDGWAAGARGHTFNEAENEDNI